MIFKIKKIPYGHIMNFVMWFFIAVLIFAGCSTEKQNKGAARKKDLSGAAISAPLQISAPQNGKRFKRGEALELSFSTRTGTFTIDSVLIYLNNNHVDGTSNADTSLDVSLKDVPLGENSIKLRSYIRDKFYDQIISVVILSDITPVNYGYKIINTFPHGTDVYTQGLVYEDGFLYESGGQYGKSSLRKIVPQNGELIKVLKLEDEFFAEGVAVVGERLVQLTWREQTAFVYDKESFTLINRVNFPVQEGWGLAYNGEKLIMSDGSPTLYFLDTEYFTEERRLSVYTDAGAVNRLNELEYYQGNIFANVYGQDYIVIINQTDGSVVGKVDFTGLLKEEDKHSSIDVLNGIAINPENNHLFVTGKYWPKLFEIELIGFDFQK